MKNVRIHYKTLFRSFEKRIIRIVDSALRKGGDLGVYGNLQEGIEPLARDFSVSIEVHFSYLSVDCGPLSGAGHDFQFRVRRFFPKINLDSVVVGEVCQDPDDFQAGPGENPSPEKE